MVGRARVSSVCAIAMAVAMVVMAIHVNACFDPTDRYSIEVVLNKPGVSYDFAPLDKLASLGYVHKLVPRSSSAKVAYIYRSHVSHYVVVVVSLQPVPVAGFEDSWKRYYLAIRVEPVTMKVSKSMYVLHYATNVERVVSTAKIRDAARSLASLGWLVSVRESANVTEMHLAKRLGNVSIYMYVAIDRGRGSTHIDTRISIPAELIEKPSEAGVEELVSKSGALSRIDRVLKLLGLGIEVSTKDFSYRYVESGDYTPLVGTNVVKKALAYELKWLRDVGVIKGLKDEDIAKIVAIAKPGCAGWNSRLVYLEGRGWVPYHELGAKASLIKGGGCIVMFDLEKVPSKVPPSYSKLATPSQTESSFTTSIATSGGSVTTVTKTITKTLTTTVTSTTVKTAYVARFPELQSLLLGVAIGASIVSTIVALLVLRKLQ